jgi:hypothetical protein
MTTADEPKRPRSRIIYMSPNLRRRYARTEEGRAFLDYLGFDYGSSEAEQPVFGPDPKPVEDRPAGGYQRPPLRPAERSALIDEIVARQTGQEAKRPLFGPHPHPAEPVRDREPLVLDGPPIDPGLLAQAGRQMAFQTRELLARMSGQTGVVPPDLGAQRRREQEAVDNTPAWQRRLDGWHGHPADPVWPDANAQILEHARWQRGDNPRFPLPPWSAGHNGGWPPCWGPGGPGGKPPITG